MRRRILSACAILFTLLSLSQQENCQNIDLQRDSIFGISKVVTPCLKNQCSANEVVNAFNSLSLAAQEDK